MGKVNRKLDFTSIDNNEKTKKCLSYNVDDKNMNHCKKGGFHTKCQYMRANDETPNEAKILDLVKVNSTKVNIICSTDRIITPKILEDLSLNQKNPKFAVVE